MNSREALRLAVAKLGQNATVREHPDPSSPARREKARIGLVALGPGPIAPDIFDVDAWPDDATCRAFRVARVAFVTARATWSKEHSRLLGEVRFRRCAVGRIEGGGMFNCIKGEGDTWEEALTKAGVAFPKVPSHRVSA